MRRLSFLLLAVALTTLAQTPTPNATYRVAGTVVSDLDNHPLQRATVEILDPENQRPIQTTTSDEDGHFAFAAVPAGLHELQGTAPSYLPTIYDEHEGFNTGIITGSEVDTESLLLKLHPESTISGTVMDESAEPVENAALHLFRQTHNFGDGRIVEAGSALTDDLGRFELSRLVPGTYFLAIIATPWYAVHPNPPQPQRMSGLQFSITDSIDPVLDVAYPATFYPGATDSTRAAPIVLHGGESLDLHFQLSPQPAVTLTIPRSTPANGEQQPFPQLSVSLQGQNLPAMGEIRQTANETVITGIAPGDYVLSQINGRAQTDAGTPIHLGDQASDATLTPPSDSAHVHALLRSAHGDALPPHLAVILAPRHGLGGSTAQVTDEKNEVNFDIVPNDYYFAVGNFNQQRPFAVRQIINASNGRPLPSNSVHLAAVDKASFLLTVIPAIHILKGVTRNDGKPFAGAFILLFPSSEISDIHTSYRQQSDLDGSFDIRNLAPGAYTLVAIENGWDLDWQNDAALTRYLPAAVTVTIPDTMEKVQSLPTPVAVQPR